MGGVRRLKPVLPVLMASAAILLAFAQQASGLDAGGPKAASAFSASLSGDGRYMAFNTGSSLTPADAGFNTDVYVRDLNNGLTVIASRASGATGAVGNGTSSLSGTPTISADGRYVAFESLASNLSPDDADVTRDIFVRDLQAETTILVSRATGGGGAKGNGASSMAHISADGHFVVFESTATNLDPADTDTNGDIYMRDILTGTTTLIDRQSGVSGTKAARAFNASVSGDGRYVVFATNQNLLTPDDPDTAVDVFVRDVQTSTTTLASRATGAAGAKGNSFSGQPSISADGTVVLWIANASNLDPADTDGTADAYARNLVTNTTQLISRATGAAGAKSDGQSGSYAVSADGRYATFHSSATNLDPADPDAAYDTYIRDLQANTTTLVSRATGAAGVKANGQSYNLTLSGDGRYGAFSSQATNLSADDTSTNEDIYVRDLQTLVTTVEDRGTPGHVRPKGATPLYASLVPAYSPCSSPNRTHGPPLAFGSCAPPAQASPSLTVGSPDANGAQANSVGSIRLDARTGDMGIAASVTDVRCAGAVATCGAANTAGGTDYVGELRATMAVRRTDKFDSSGVPDSITLTDTTFEFVFPCGPTAATLGGSCAIATTANALIPGLIRSGDRTAMELGAIQVFDGGPDGDADTPGDSLFATQGVFVP
jgi:hypothetical protein